MFVLLFVIFINFELDIKIRIQNKSNYVSLVLRLLRGLIRIRFNLSLEALEKGAFYLIIRKMDSDFEHSFRMEEIFDMFKRNRTKYTKFSQHIKYLASKINIQCLNLDMKFGLHDAAQTALVYGSAITILSSIKGYLLSKFGLNNIKIRLVPYFNETKLDLVLGCIINIRLGHIIITGIRMLLHSIKGGDNIGRTSYRKYNENHYGKY